MVLAVLHNSHLPMEFPLTYFTIILIINAYNLIDGIDGFAGSLLVYWLLYCLLHIFIMQGFMPTLPLFGISRQSYCF